MNRESVKVLFLHEIRMLARDRRTVILALVLPLLVMPLMLYVVRSIERQRARSLKETTFRYAVSGAEAGTVRRLIAARRDQGLRLEELPVADAEAALRARRIHLHVRALDAGEAAALEEAEGEVSRRRPREAPAAPGREAARPAGVPLVEIRFQGDREESRAGAAAMKECLLEAARGERDRLLRERGWEMDPADIFRIERRSLAGAAQAAGSQIGKFLTLFLVMFLLSGGSVVALDSVAGEKERGSLETLLSTAARRSEIVAAKQLAIFSVALVILLVNAANILLYVNFRLIELPADWVIGIRPASVLALILLLVPVGAFLSAVLLSLSAYAKSYKEAQLYFFPVYLVALVPALAAVLPGVSLRSAIVLVPVANVSVAVREILAGRFDWPMIAAAWAVMAFAAWRTMRLSTRMLSDERLITAADLDAAAWARGPELFSRQVFAWYAVMAAALFAAAVNFPQVRSFRAQILFNELVLFLGASLLMIRRYRLPVREALALRLPRPAVWPAVAAAIPAGHLAAVGVFRLADLVVPVPRQVLEQFSRELVPADIPAWQTYLLAALLPGICEEIAFRGPLLYGLRRRFRPATLIVVVGIVFGVFHVALFRIIPTAFLGMVLTALALLTGSIFPGMLLHAGNNALAYWLGRRNLSAAGWHWGWHAAGAAVFVACLYAVYRVRTPYPGLRGASAPAPAPAGDPPGPPAGGS